MPHPRPLASLRFGSYDEPPASSESSTPRTRRSRLQQVLRATANMAANDLAEMAASTQPPRHPVLGSLSRRRQRSPGPDQRDTGSSEDTRRRRPKRRRLDAGVSPPPTQPIKYGYFGQVEPGRLRFDIISCDGGEHTDPRHPSTYLGPQNLLRHDKSVYCSERPCSSIVLRHADDTPFCLEKLHILGPEHGFTAPVCEGIVHVAMTLNDLSKYMDPPPHARMQGIHCPPYRHQRSSRSSPERITWSDALRDPEVSAFLDGRPRVYASRTDAANGPPEDALYGDHYNFDRYDADSHCEFPSPEDGPDIIFVLDDNSSPVVQLSDEEPGPEESSSQEVLDFRRQRLNNMHRRPEIDNWEREERYTGANTDYYDGNERARDAYSGLRHLDAMMARSRMADSPQHDLLNDERYRFERSRNMPAEPAALATECPSSGFYRHHSERPGSAEHYDDGLNDPRVTRARFHIKRQKYKVAIKFDPPVSGRFILLKLWANRGNVDVQSVIAKGFGGSRFFPAIEFR